MRRSAESPDDVQSVHVVLEHLTDEQAAAVDADAVRATAERFVASSGGVAVVITGDYRASLQSRSERYRTGAAGDDAWASAGGVSIVDDAGGHVIVLRHALWTLERHDPLQTVAHEALHVGARQRGEDMRGLLEQLSFPDDARQVFAGYAGMAIEEYRVDRAVFSQPEWGDTGLRHDFDEDLKVFANDCNVAWQRAERGGPDDLAHFASTLSTAFMQMTYTAAGVCAADLASGGRITPSRSEPGWSRLVGPYYDHLCRRLSQVPDATQPSSADDLETAALELVPVLLSWAAYFGWTVTPGEAQGPARTDWDL